MKLENLFGNKVELRLKNDSKEVRVFQLSFRGLKALTEKYGNVDELVEKLTEVKGAAPTLDMFDSILSIIWACLLKDDPSITIDKVTDLMDDNFAEMLVALSAIRGVQEKGGEQAPAPDAFPADASGDK